MGARNQRPVPDFQDPQARIDWVHDQLVPGNVRELLDQWVGQWRTAWRMVATDAALRTRAKVLVDHPSLDDLRTYLLEGATLQELLMVHCALLHMSDYAQDNGQELPTEPAELLRHAIDHYFEAQPAEPC